MSEAPASPCISVCVVNLDGVCLGCGRTNNEIGAWLGATASEQQQIVDDAAKRLETINAALFNSPE